MLILKKKLKKKILKKKLKRKKKAKKLKKKKLILKFGIRHTNTGTDGVHLNNNNKLQMMKPLEQFSLDAHLYS